MINLDDLKEQLNCKEWSPEWMEVKRLAQKLKRKTKIGSYTVDEEVEEALATLKLISSRLFQLVQNVRAFNESSTSLVETSKEIAVAMKELADPYNSFSPQTRRALKETMGDNIFESKEEKGVFKSEYRCWTNVRSYEASINETSACFTDSELKSVLSTVEAYAKKANEIVAAVSKSASRRQKALDDYDHVFNALDALMLKSETRELTNHEVKTKYTLERKLETKRAHYDGINSTHKKELPYLFMLFEKFYQPLNHLIFFTQLQVYYQAQLKTLQLQECFRFDVNSPHLLDDITKTEAKSAAVAEQIEDLGIVSFRDNYYHDLVSEAPQLVSKYYRAVYRFEAQQKGDLALEEGDIIEVTSAKGNWWQGKTETRTGTFPSNYVEPLI